MSGYKNMWFDTREEHQAFMAFAGYHGHDDEDHIPDELFGKWDELSDESRQRWRTAAGNVAHDAMTMPRF